jgi:hypothetical protein
LAAHLRDAEQTPPELRASLPDGLTLADHSDRVLAEVADWSDRVKGLLEVRAKEGRVLSGMNRDRLMAVAEAVRTAHMDLMDLISAADGTPKAADRTEMEVMTALFRANGVPI